MDREITIWIILKVILTIVVAALASLAIYWLGWVVPMHIWDNPHSLLGIITKAAFYIGLILSIIGCALSLITCSSSNREVRIASLIRLVESLFTCAILWHFVSIMHGA